MSTVVPFCVDGSSHLVQGKEAGADADMLPQNAVLTLQELHLMELFPIQNSP